MPSTDQIRATIDQYIERFNVGDVESWASLFAADAHHEDPVGTPANVGRSAIATFLANSRSLFGVLKLSLKDEPIIIGNEAVITMSVQVGSGEQRATVPHIVDVICFEDDGHIASVRAYWDMATLAPDPES